MKHIKKISLLTILFIFSSCETEESNKERFDIENMLHSVSKTVIIPTTSLFVITSEELVNKALLLQAENNLNNFENFTQAWYHAMDGWQTMQVVNFGELSKMYYNVSIANWPANSFFIDQIISGNEEISPTYIDNKGGSSKGLFGIEYLAFDKNKPTAALHASITERYLGYFIAVAQNNLKYATLIENYWLENASEFTAATTNGIDGSITLMVNQIVHLIDDFAKNKIGRQAALYNSTNKSPEDTECYRSAYSYECLLHGTQSLQAFFKGNSSTIEELPGIDDYLDQVQGDSILSTEINQQFQYIYSLLSSDQSLADDIEKDAKHINDLYKAYRALGVLFNTDVASLLSITIVPSDADGD